MNVPVPLRAPICLLLAAAAAFVLGPGSVFGSLTTKVTNTNNAAASSLFTCAGAATASSAFLAYPLSEAIYSPASDVSGNNRSGTYTITGVTYGQSGPCPRDGGKAVTLNGSSGYVYSTTQVASPGPATFTEEVWFNTTTTRGGKLIGFGSSSSGASGSYDRHIYMTDAGKLVFGVYPNAVKIVTSPASYNDGQWHLATATLAASGSQVGMRLYVDGALVASDTTVTTAQSYAGYWRIGYDNLASWTSAPTSSFFAGKMAFAQVYGTALTPLQIDAHYRAGAS